MTLLSFSSVYAGDILVYTTLEDDEVAVYLPAFRKPDPDINVTLYRIRPVSSLPSLWQKRTIPRRI